MKARGKVHKFGGNVNTDDIIPAKFLNTTDPKELASHCMEGISADFAKNVKPGDIIVAGTNFGCGSSREHAPFSIKSAGVSCVIAETFARIFYRNSINIGLPILESKEAARDIENGDEVEVDFDNGEIKNITTGKTYKSQSFPEFMRKIITAGGLLNMLNVDNPR
ncbi:MAG: 3-isopropylmalate dehydratase small subunit [Candidatus Omnitrophica bacterium]|nr:3-isopropylmalate dehydratase small subunit [Candidatus Omnitrophota bacterium]